MTNLRVSDFDFHLPPDLIAQQPPAVRGQSRMLVMDRATGVLRDDTFSNLTQHLNPGDLLVLNDSRVIPARLYARRTLRREKESPTGRIEVMLTEPVPPQQPQTLGAPGLDSETWESTNLNQHDAESTANQGAPSILSDSERREGESKDLLLGISGAWVGEHEPQPSTPNRWRALVRPSRKVAIGEILAFPDPSGEILLTAEVIARGEHGERTLEFAPVSPHHGSFYDIPAEGGFFSILDRIGHIPLPPYIRRDDAPEDRTRYQTVFARDPGSVAAPTAGLHFTQDVLAQLSSKGIEIAHVTLHVGLGTFAPLHADRLADVHLHTERYTISAQAADALNRAVRDKRRIVAAGTTTVRTLEAAALASVPGQLQPHSGVTSIFISPGFQFRLVNALLTNFHLPQSSLLMLVSAFAGRENILAAYSHAVQQKYRFFSYGDCMFLA